MEPRPWIAAKASFSLPRNSVARSREVPSNSHWDDPQPKPKASVTARKSFGNFGLNLRNSSTSSRQDEQEPSEQTDSSERVKTKLMSMWNNVRYGWTVRTKTNFNCEAPVWFLGKCYHRKLSDHSPLRGGVLNGGARQEISPGLALGLEEFKEDFVSRVWFTYRREFPVLSGSSFTTDCGWGCMLRSGQMMLAQALVNHFLSRCWRWNPNETHDEEIHRRIISWFGDMNSDINPFSLHRLVSYGESSGKRAGDWYGPASVAHILKQAVEIAQKNTPSLREICVYVGQDCAVYKQDILDLCYGRTQRWQSVIILIPLRLGGEELNSIYINCLKEILSDESSIGIIGGRPKHSLYFIGYQEEKLIHLDPHYCQEMVDVNQPNFPLASFHCTHPRKMAFSRMDPSCTIGFYCETRQDLDHFFTCHEVLSPPHPLAEYPLFVIMDGRFEESEAITPTRALRLESFSSIQLWQSPSGSNSDDDEFVFL